MITITPQDYNRVARKLIERIGSDNYFSDTVECELGECDASLTATLIVYRSDRTDSGIANLVPVWWEFHTTTAEGERLNDFSFATLKEVIFK